MTIKFIYEDWRVIFLEKKLFLKKKKKLFLKKKFFPKLLLFLRTYLPTSTFFWVGVGGARPITF